MAKRAAPKRTTPSPKKKANRKRVTPAARPENGHALGDPGKFRALVDMAQRKFNQARDTGPLKDMWAELRVLTRLLRHWSKGEYRRISWKSIAIIIGALLYFLNPLDVIPDFIPVIGQLDDALVLGLVLKAVRDDLDAFKKWEAGPHRAAP